MRQEEKKGSVMLFEVKDFDKKFYTEKLKDFLPDKIIDIHTHVWLDEFKSREKEKNVRTVTWVRRVAKDNSIEDLMETYRLMFPGKQVTPMIFSSLARGDRIDDANDYIRRCGNEHAVPSLLYACPWWNGEVLEEKIKAGGFIGIKVYLSLSDPSIAANDITIFDFLPHSQLEVINRLGLIVILHIPRKDRFKDPVNLSQILEIHEKYRNLKLIIAHVGRAYCDEDVGDSFEVLKKADRLLYDFSANTNSWVFEQLIRAVGPKRILFGSDMPILRMRMKRITRGGVYINVVPKGLYGDVSNDKNMEETDRGEDLTFFMYEEIDAFRKASEACGLRRGDIEDIFFNNGAGLIRQTAAGRKFLFDN